MQNSYGSKKLFGTTMWNYSTCLGQRTPPICLPNMLKLLISDMHSKRWAFGRRAAVPRRPQLQLQPSERVVRAQRRVGISPTLQSWFSLFAAWDIADFAILVVTFSPLGISPTLHSWFSLFRRLGSLRLCNLGFHFFAAWDLSDFAILVFTLLPRGISTTLQSWFSRGRRLGSLRLWYLGVHFFAAWNLHDFAILVFTFSPLGNFGNLGADNRTRSHGGAESMGPRMVCRLN